MRDSLRQHCWVNAKQKIVWYNNPFPSVGCVSLWCYSAATWKPGKFQVPSFFSEGIEHQILQGKGTKHCGGFDVSSRECGGWGGGFFLELQSYLGLFWPKRCRVLSRSGQHSQTQTTDSLEPQRVPVGGGEHYCTVATEVCSVAIEHVLIASIVFFTLDKMLAPCSPGRGFFAIVPDDFPSWVSKLR